MAGFDYPTFQHTTNLLYWGVDGTAQYPRFKKLLADHQGVVNRTLWHYDDVNHTQGAAEELKRIDIVGFSTPKPTRLIKKMLQIATDKDAIVMDFFSGSATTAHAVMQLNAEDGGNRRFIMVQLPEVCDEISEAAKAGYSNICEIGKARIRRAGATITGKFNLDEEKELDVGFRVFKLDSSNLKLWDSSPIRGYGEGAEEELYQRLLDHLEILKSDRTNEDVVFEVMLKLGQDLCEVVQPLDANGKIVYGVGEDVKFIVCLADDIQPEDASAMADYAPGRIVFADSCFSTTEQKSNVRLTLKDKGITIKTL